MIKKIDSAKMGKSRSDWLTSWFHFSFAEYFSPDHMNYGALRVINDDLIRPGFGFDLHPHQDMEIITYVVEGQLTHGDSLNNQRTLSRGQVQYMSAGTGVVHSEHNRGNLPLRLLQIWIFPDRTGYPPSYSDHPIPWNSRRERWLPIASGDRGNAPIHIHQDMNLFVTELPRRQSLEFPLKPSRQAYLVQIEGESSVNGVTLQERDAMEICGEESVHVTALECSHLILFDMKR